MSHFRAIVSNTENKTWDVLIFNNGSCLVSNVHSLPNLSSERLSNVAGRWIREHERLSVIR